MIGTAVVATALSIAAAQPVQMRGVVLDNVRIIDGSGAAPIENGRIVIERDRIARIGRAAEIRVPAGFESARPTVDGARGFPARLPGARRRSVRSIGGAPSAPSACVILSSM